MKQEIQYKEWLVKLNEAGTSLTVMFGMSDYQCLSIIKATGPMVQDPDYPEMIEIPYGPDGDFYRVHLHYNTCTILKYHDHEEVGVFYQNVFE